MLSEQDESKDLKHDCSRETALNTCTNGRTVANIQHVNILAQIWKIAMHNITSMHGPDLQ